MAILRDEAAYVEEWLAHHLALGVQHAFLYDNDSTDDLRGVLRRAQAHGIVTLIDWPRRGRQFDAYLHAVRMFGPACAWTAFVDLDEFIVPHQDPDIPSMLARLDGADQVQLAVREFAFSGHRTPPDDLVTASYTTAHRRVPRYAEPETVRVKCIARPAAILEARVHTCRTLHGRTVDATGRPVPEVSEVVDPQVDPFAVAQVNHYYTKSWSEWEQKRKRGSASGRITRPEVPFDLPGGTQDLAALRHVAGTRAMLASLRALDPDPFRYGSRLAIPLRPHDGFGPDAARALGNHLAGLPEPSPNVARRVPGLPDGRGAVARSDGPPAAGELATSVHVAVFVERLRARVAWTLPESGDPGHGVSGPAWPLVLDTQEGSTARCQAIVFGAVVDGPVSLRIDASPAATAPPRTAVVRLAEAGGYLGIVQVDPDPACVERVSLSVEAGPSTSGVTLTDLVLLTYA